MKHSESIKQIAAALCKAQATIGKAKKDATNPYFNSNYSTLGSVWEACHSSLLDNGICVIQGGDGVLYSTTFMHTSGEWITASLPLVLSKNDMQGLGSAVSYCRRYLLAGMAGVIQEDDDGNAASRPQAQATKKPAPSAPPVQAAKARVQQEFPGVEDSYETESSYVVPFGKHKGRKMSEMGPDDVEGYARFLMKSADLDGKPLSGNASEFCAHAKPYLSGFGIDL